MQPQQLKRILDMEKITHDLRSRRKGTTTWNTFKNHESNVAQQQPGDFIKNFQNWRDEIYNYENSATEIDSSMKIALLLRLSISV
eukprot:1236272-Amphidinium_carterae.1